jgi:acyl-homoserine lactone acylase PvdQ
MPRPTGPLRFEAEHPNSSLGDGHVQNQFEQKDGHSEWDGEYRGVLRRPGEGPPLQELLRWLARSLAVMAVLSSVALLCAGATPLLTSLPTYIAKASLQGWAVVKSLPLSALPLLLAGSSYLLLQAILRPRPPTRAAEACHAGNSVSLVGSRPAYACRRSGDGIGQSGDRTLRGRSRADHLD